MSRSHTESRKLIAYVGSYADGPGGGPGGIDVLHVSADGKAPVPFDRVAAPAQAGYLVHCAELSTLYAADERKTDGRGPTGPVAAVHAFAVDQRDGRLTPLNALQAPGPFPTFLSVCAERRALVGANHGSFDHVERIVRTEHGWDVEYFYDDSAVIRYDLDDDGSLSSITDIKVFADGGTDPNGSPQTGGHGQASGHAHCAVVDPTGNYVVVCDKATDRITVFALGCGLEQVSSLQLPAESGPRHIAFDLGAGRAYATCEFSSTLVSFAFDVAEGSLRHLAEVPTVGRAYDGHNEPADVRVHPNGELVYVNNRGEDSLAWFHVGERSGLRRGGSVPLAKSEHPGLAARSFAFAPDGSFLLLADRPANLVRSYTVDEDSGALEQIAELSIADPVFVAFAEVA